VGDEIKNCEYIVVAIIVALVIVVIAVVALYIHTYIGRLYLSVFIFLCTFSTIKN